MPLKQPKIRLLTQICGRTSQNKYFSNVTSLKENSHMPSKAGTTILLFHNGQPRSSFYAKNHLSNMLNLNIYLPLTIGEGLVNRVYLRPTSMLKKCLVNSENRPHLSESLENLSLKLKESLSQVVPEFGPFNCAPCFLYDTPTVEEKFEEILRNGTDNLIILSMYPFSTDYLLNPMLRKFHSLLNSNTRILMESSPNKSPTPTNIYVAKNSHAAFTSNILANLGQTQSLIQYWAEILSNKLTNSKEIDGIIFSSYLPVVNQKEFIKGVEESSKRIIYSVYGNAQTKAIPWRNAYFSSWDQFWPLLNRQQIKNQFEDLRRRRNSQNVLLVPLTNLIEDFDTQTVLPSLISNLENVNLLNIGEDVDLLSRKTLAHSLVEVVKNKLLHIRPMNSPP